MANYGGGNESIVGILGYTGLGIVGLGLLVLAIGGVLSNRHFSATGLILFFGGGGGTVIGLAVVLLAVIVSMWK